MIDILYVFVLSIGGITIWSAMGAVVLIVMNFRAERALSRISGRSDWRKGVVLILWPVTLLAVLLLQFNPRYRGSNHDSIEYPDAFL